jgi:hypothetical protein
VIGDQSCATGEVRAAIIGMRSEKVTGELKKVMGELSARMWRSNLSVVVYAPVTSRCPPLHHICGRARLVWTAGQVSWTADNGPWTTASAIDRGRR